MNPFERGALAPRTLLALLAVLLAATLVLTACGGGGSSSSSTEGGETSTASEESSEESSEEPEEIQVDEKFFNGELSDPVPTEGPKAESGKTIWFSNCQAYVGCQRFAEGVESAAEVLGWKLHVVDDKADPTTGISIIKQAVSAKADGIIETLFDCPTIKSGLQAAKSAGIPVVTIAGLDCNEPVFGEGGEALFGAPVLFGEDESPLDFYIEQGKRDAEFVLALAKSYGVEDPSVLQVKNEDQVFQKERHAAFDEEMEAQCPECKITPLTFTVPDTANGKAEQIFKSGMLANPNTDVLYFSNDAWLPTGLQAALEANRGKFKFLCCGDSSGQQIANVRADNLATDAVAANYQPFQLAGWDTMDVLNRLFNGETAAEIPGEANVVFYIDKEHNLPAPEEPVKIPLNYEPQFTELWQTGHNKGEE